VTGGAGDRTLTDGRRRCRCVPPPALTDANNEDDEEEDDEEMLADKRFEFENYVLVRGPV